MAATLVAYNPVNRNAFVNFDDDHYITGNAHIQHGVNWETVKWAFSNYYEANWHPLTWLSHALDFELFGLNPIGHHYTSVVLHALNAVLLFLLLLSATGFTWRSLMVAALFALHPVNVESVAWASERKNVLSMMFLLLALLAYGKYARKPRAWSYALVAVLFACGLMSKPQVITLPFLLLLWDYWPLQRFSTGGNNWAATAQNLLLEKAPLFAMTLISAVITMQAQKAGGAIHSPIIYPFSLRLENAIVSYSRYLGKAFWPIGLSPLYPHPLDLLKLWQVIGSAIFLLLVTVLVLRNRRHGYLVTGWFWFLGSLVPMIGLVQVGEQAMADRYAYVPFLGLFIMVIWGISDLAESKKVQPVALAVPACAILAVFGVLTYRQVGYWHDSETLWSYALRVTDVRSYKAHFNLAITYDGEGRYDEAIQQFRQAIDPRDDDPRIHLGLGIYDLRHGHPQDAVEEFKAALPLSRDRNMSVDTLSNLGSAYAQLHNDAQAKQNFLAALQIDPNKATAMVGLGLLAQKSQNFDEAIAQFSHAMEIEPTPVGYLLLARALEAAGRKSDADDAIARARQFPGDFNQAQQAAGQLLKF